MANHEIEKVLLVSPLPEIRRFFRMLYESVVYFYGWLEVQESSIEIKRWADILGHSRGCDRGCVGADCAEISSHAIYCQKKSVDVGICNGVCVNKENTLVFYQLPGLKF